MNPRICIAASCLALSIILCARVIGQEKKEDSVRVVKIGAVGYGSGTGKIFANLTTVLIRRGYPSTYILYPTYDAMVDALDSGEIDIAWNSPLSHAQFHVRNECESQTLAMRDVDVGLRVTLIAKEDSGIKSLNDLTGKRVIIGRQKYHEGMLSAHFLKKGVTDFHEVKIVQLAEKDAEGKRTDTSQHILQALSEGRGNAAVIPLDFWSHSVEWRRKHPGVGQVWKSPEFNHCVFTAAKDFDAKLGSQFTKLMTSLDPKDPLIAEFNRAERTKKWLPGNSKGFESLIEAIQAQEEE